MHVIDALLLLDFGPLVRAKCTADVRTEITPHIMASLTLLWPERTGGEVQIERRRGAKDARSRKKFIQRVGGNCLVSASV